MKMRKIDLFTMSIRNLFRRKFRTVLTIMGVVIGATSIMLMLSLGLAMDKNMEEQMAMMGDLTQITVRNYGGSEGGKVLDDKTVREFEKMENVEKAVPLINGLYAYLSCGKYRTCWNMEIYAMSEADMEALGYEPSEGRRFSDDEKKSILLGGYNLRYFTKNGKEIDWSNGEPEPMPFDMNTQKLSFDVIEYDWQTGKPNLEGQNGKIKRPKPIEVDVVGIFDENDYSVADKIVVPKALFDTLKKASIDYQKAMGWYSDEDKEKDKKVSYNEIIVKVNDRKNVVSVLEALKADGYSAWNDMEDLERMEEQSKARQLALGAIGIVSFIVAAIGIANTMMMSIYERTKEIGVMKVIGAKITDIKHMFLMESLLIGFFGGTIGAVLTLLASLIMNASGEKIAEMMNMYGTTTVSVVNPQLLLSGVVFSVIIGLLSGYFPAKKATKLSALSAIRTE